MSRKIVHENQFFYLMDNLKKLLVLSEYLEVRSTLIEKGVNENTFDGWKRRGKIPAQGLVLISEKTGFSVDQIKGTPFADLKGGANKYGGRSEVRIKALLVNAEKILRSSTPFSEALERNIDAFIVGTDLFEKAGNARPQKVALEESQ